MSEQTVSLRTNDASPELPNRVCCALTVLHSLRPPAALVHNNHFPELPEAEQRALNAASAVLVRYLLGEESFDDRQPYTERRSLGPPTPPEPQPQGAKL